MVSGRRVLAVGVVGAFTPVCSRQHLPEFIPYQKELVDAGVVDEVVCISAVDPFVLSAWANSLRVDGRITMLSDTDAAIAKSMDLTIDLESLGLGLRSHRYVLFVNDAVIEILNVEDTPADVDVTSADAIRRLLVTE